MVSCHNRLRFFRELSRERQEDLMRIVEAVQRRRPKCRIPGEQPEPELASKFKGQTQALIYLFHLSLR